MCPPSLGLGPGRSSGGDRMADGRGDARLADGHSLPGLGVCWRPHPPPTRAKRVEDSKVLLPYRASPRSTSLVLGQPFSVPHSHYYM